MLPFPYQRWNNPFELIRDGNFDNWKKIHDELLKKLGQHFLTLKESQLATVFSEWEGGLHLRKQSENNVSQLSCLLVVSILYYFRRSFEHLKAYYPIVKQLQSSLDRNIAKASCVVMKLIGKISADNQPFLRESLEIAKKFLSVKQRNTYSFNAVLILKIIGKFLPTDFFNVTSYHIPEVWTAICSPDSEFRNNAVKVMIKHFALLDSTTAFSFGKSVYMDSIDTINTYIQNPIGILQILECIYSLAPAILQINQLFNTIMNAASHNIEYIIASTSLFCKIIQDSPSYFSSNICHTYVNQTFSFLQHPNCKRQIILNLMAILKAIPREYAQVQEIGLECRKIIQNHSLIDNQILVYELLYFIIENFSEFTIPSNMLTLSTPSTWLVKVTARVFNNAYDMKTRILEWYDRGINKSAPVKDVTIALQILIEFKSYFFENHSNLVESLRHILFNQNDSVRMLLADALLTIGTQQAIIMLIRLSVFDKSEPVRLHAIKTLAKVIIGTNIDGLANVLADSSYAVRNCGIPVLAKTFEINPLASHPIIAHFITTFVQSTIHEHDMQKLSDACSILPAVAKYFVKIVPSSIDDVIWLCVVLLLNGMPFPNQYGEVDENLPHPANFPAEDIRNRLRVDMLNNYSLGFLRLESFSEKDVILRRIFLIEGETWSETRDASLFRTLSALATYVVPYTLQVVPIFINAFKNNHKECVYIAAIDALTNITIAFNARVNFCTYFPDFLPSLMNLLSERHSDKVAIAVLKLIGTIGPSGKRILNLSVESKNDEYKPAIKAPNYFTKTTLSFLLKLLKQPSPSTLIAITRIILEDPKSVLPSLGQIITAFVQSFKITENPASLFVLLDNIAFHAKSHMLPYVEQLMPMLIYNIHDISCMSLIATLSTRIGYDFTPYAAVLFPNAIRLITSRDIVFLKVLLVFLVSSIVYQKQSASTLIDVIEQRISLKKDGEDQFIQLIMNKLCTLLQSRSVNLEGGRILQMCFNLALSGKAKLVDELLINLCFFANVSLQDVRDFSECCDIVFPKFLEFYGPNKEKRPSISPKERNLKSKKPDTSNLLLYEYKDDCLNDCPEPVFNQQRKWLDDLSVLLITNCPSFAIRGSIAVALQYRAFKNEIFPYAFLSCWLESSREAKAKIARTIQTATQIYKDLDPIVFDLLGTLTMVGETIDIPDDILSEASSSTPLSLFYMMRHFRSHQNDKEIIERMLSIYVRMRMSDSARGLLLRTGDNIGRESEAKWSEQLGEYEKALELYDMPKNILGQIRIYSKLEQWDTIRGFYETFPEMNEDDKQNAAIYFAQSFFYGGDSAKVDCLIDYFKNNYDFASIHFKSVYYISTGNYAAAEKEIAIGFNKLVENRSIYGGNDTNLAMQHMEFAHQLVELAETLELKKSGGKNVPQIWQNRLVAFSEESDAWLSLIKTRSLVVSPADHINTCIKMLSVLRKEHKFRAIDSYVQRLSTIQNSPQFIINALKVLWARGERTKAIDSVCYLTRCITIANDEELVELINSEEFKMHEHDLQFLTPFIEAGNVSHKAYVDYMNAHGVDDVMRARIIRIAATWQYNLYKANTSSVTSLSNILSSFQRSNRLNPKDYRTWAGMAYATSRALSHSEEKVSEYAIEAITGFLEATKLKPSFSLEYLCLMFSILFRYGEFIQLPDSVEEQIINLPPSIVIQIVPQIVAHVTHKEESIRRIVHSIITKFASQHFEAVVFALNILSYLKDESKATIVRDLLNSLGSLHTNVFADAKLFITGMRGAAVSLAETLIALINRATQSKSQDEYKSTIKDIISVAQSPKCEHDRLAMRICQNCIQKVQNAYRQMSNNERDSGRMMYDNMMQLYVELENGLKKLDTVSLAKFSESLAAKRHFSLVVPGQYTVEHTGPKIHYIDPTLHVLNTAQHPRSTHLVDESGKKWKFLLKGNEDLRLDQRIMQFFSLLNSLIRTNRLTSDFGVTIEQYAIIPFAPDAGLVTWVTGADTLLQVVYDFRNERGISPTLEQEVVKEITEANYTSLNSLQQLEICKKIFNISPANELRETLWLRSASSQAWVAHTRGYTVSTALMSIAGFVIGLGDRHPSNIMIQRHTGRVVHIDFGDSFDSAILRKKFPEYVPFRLTRMIVNALDGESVEGLFRKSCEDILWVLRDNLSPIVAQLEIFVHEPIFSNKTSSSSGAHQHTILSRVAAKLSGLHESPTGHEMKTNEQVDLLISKAIDPKLYARHYIGWCPFW